MKKILVVAAAITFSLGLNAQTKESEKQEPNAQEQNAQDPAVQEHKMNDAKAMQSKEKMKDCVMMKEGKMVSMVNGKVTPLEKDVTMKNGVTVMKDGKMKTKEGKVVAVKEGEAIDMDGNLVMNAKPHESKMEK